jgi:cardiolipin synthase
MGMGLANWLTVLRILLVPVFVTLLVYRKPGAAMLVFLGAALTDLLDGWVARRHGLSSRLGAFLDPLADKILLTASFVTLTWLKVIPFWITAVVLSRDAFLALGTLLIHMVGARVYPRPTWAGKAATFFQILTVLSGLVSHYWASRPVWKPLVLVAAAFTLISGLQYLVQGMRFLNAAQDAEREASHERLYSER